MSCDEGLTVIKAGDTATKQWQASSDLSGATSVRVVVGRHGETIINREVDAVVGQIVTVIFLPAETVAHPGDWFLEIESTWSPPTPSPQTFPEEGYAFLRIDRDLG